MLLKKVIIRLSVRMLCVATLCIVQGRAASIALKPVDDVCIRLFGGGEGFVSFVKFDISSVPPGQTIDSAVLEGYVWFAGANWDGDAKIFNVNSQTWQESDSSAVVNRILTSDSTYQASGFGTAVGWTRSTDVKGIFLKDYTAARTFCSFKIRDPDDITMVPMPGSFPNDSNDSLAVGNRVMTQNICFYPHEYSVDTSRIIRLIVYYQGTAIVSPPLENKIRQIEALPNPFTNKIHIRWQTAYNRLQVADGGLQMKIYDAAGKLVKDLSASLSVSGQEQSVSWDGRDEHGREVASGIFIYRFDIWPDAKTGQIMKFK